MGPRRSPRNHPAAKSKVALNIHVKPAPIPWDQDPDLSMTLLSAMESSVRWRNGLFSSSTLNEPRKRLVLCLEIAQALFSRHPLHTAAFNRRPASFAQAVLKKVDSFSTLSSHQTRSRSSKSVNVPQDARFWTDAHRSIASSVPQRPHTQASTSSWNPVWLPTVPEDLQREIILFALAPLLLQTQSSTHRRSPSQASSHIHSIAAAQRMGALRLVNSTWCRIVSPHMFKRMYIPHQSRFFDVLVPPNWDVRMTTPADFAPREPTEAVKRAFRVHEHPLKFLKTLAVSVPPRMSDSYVLVQCLGMMQKAWCDAEAEAASDRGSPSSSHRPSHPRPNSTPFILLPRLPALDLLEVRGNQIERFLAEHPEQDPLFPNPASSGRGDGGGGINVRLMLALAHLSNVFLNPRFIVVARGEVYNPVPLVHVRPMFYFFGGIRRPPGALFARAEDLYPGPAAMSPTDVEVARPTVLGMNFHSFFSASSSSAMAYAGTDVDVDAETINSNPILRYYLQSTSSSSSEPIFDLIIVKSHNPASLALASYLVVLAPFKRILLVGWDNSGCSEEWRAWVEVERNRERGRTRNQQRKQQGSSRSRSPRRNPGSRRADEAGEAKDDEPNLDGRSSRPSRSSRNTRRDNPVLLTPSTSTGGASDWDPHGKVSWVNDAEWRTLVSLPSAQGGLGVENAGLGVW